MTNDSERNFEQQKTDTADQSKKNPSHETGRNRNQQQDPSKKNPSQVDEPRPREGEGEQPEKRRA